MDQCLRMNRYRASLRFPKMAADVGTGMLAIAMRRDAEGHEATPAAVITCRPSERGAPFRLSIHTRMGE